MILFKPAVNSFNLLIIWFVVSLCWIVFCYFVHSIDICWMFNLVFSVVVLVVAFMVIYLGVLWLSVVNFVLLVVLAFTVFSWCALALTWGYLGVPTILK